MCSCAAIECCGASVSAELIALCGDGDSDSSSNTSLYVAVGGTLVAAFLVSGVLVYLKTQRAVKSPRYTKHSAKSAATEDDGDDSDSDDGHHGAVQPSAVAVSLDGQGAGLLPPRRASVDSSSDDDDDENV